MTKALDLDLKKLKARAFDRAEWAGEALQRYHAAARKLDEAVVRPLRGLYQWMFVPTTLWPFNVQDVLEDCLTTLEKGKRLNSRHRLLIELLPEPPDDTICAAVADHELHVQKGTYENLVKTQAKYSQNEIAIRNDPQLRLQWARIKAAFDVQSYRDHKGVRRAGQVVDPGNAAARGRPRRDRPVERADHVVAYVDFPPEETLPRRSLRSGGDCCASLRPASGWRQGRCSGYRRGWHSADGPASGTPN